MDGIAQPPDLQREPRTEFAGIATSSSAVIHFCDFLD